MSYSCYIQLLGGLTVQHGGQTHTHFRARATALLLAYLAFHRRAHTRESLIEVLWPDLEPEVGSSRFRPELSWLRRCLEPHENLRGTVLLSARQTVQLNPETTITDVAEFLERWEAAARASDASERLSQLGQAVKRYTGELLPGFYEDWVLTERAHLADIYRRAVQQYAAALAATGDRDGAIHYGRAVLRLDPLSEEAHADLMRYYAAAGQPSAVLRQYREMERVLREEIGVAPSEESRALMRQLRLQAQESRWREEAPPPSSHRLPPSLTRFFGREEEIAHLIGLLHGSPPATDRSRLITLTGPGGAGKTRVAIETATSLKESLGGAVWFVPLAALTSARQIPGALLETLGLSLEPGIDPLAQAAAYLRERNAPSLLLLDNLEHLLDEAAPLVRRLLEQVPLLTCLVTSRQRLNLEGEREFPLRPLPVPTEPAMEPAESLAQNPSVSLFVDRAQAARADFRLTAENAGAVAELCARLDGLPLALELAAARMAVLTPIQMVAQMERRFELLVSRRRDATERHRSLWAALESSYLLLAPELQRLFARLSVLRGRWTAEAVEAVWETPALDLLEQLRDASLLLSEEEEGAMRFRMLETLREYAEDQLSADEAQEARRCLAQYLLARAEEAAMQWRGPERPRRTAEIGTDYDNFRAALVWCLGEPVAEESGESVSPWGIPGPPDAPDAEKHVTGLRLAAALADYWKERDAIAEGVPWLSVALKQSAGLAPAAPRARALEGLGRLLTGWGRVLLDPGQHVAARWAYEEALRLFVESNDTLGKADVLLGIGRNRLLAGETQTAWECFEESLAQYRALSFLPGVADALNAMACTRMQQGDAAVARTLFHESHEAARAAGFASSIAQLNEGVLDYQSGDYPAARVIFEEHLSHARAQGHRAGLAWILGLLASVCRQLGDLATAQACLEEDLAVRMSLGIRVNTAPEQALLAVVLSDRGDYLQARAHLQEAVAVSAVPRDGGEVAAMPLYRMLVACAIVVAAEGASRDEPSAELWAVPAARLLAAAEVVRETFGEKLPEEYRADYARLLPLLQDRLGEAAFAASWAEGRAMAPEQALEDAL
jgi:predicted ATPase/DNA-binding SARP family transcriptional activator